MLMGSPRAQIAHGVLGLGRKLQHLLCLVLGLHVKAHQIIKVWELQAVGQLHFSQQAHAWRQQELPLAHHTAFKGPCPSSLVLTW